MKSFQSLIKSADSFKGGSLAKVDLITVISQQLNLPAQNVKKGIRGGLLTFNNKKVYLLEVNIQRPVKIRFQEQLIKIPITKDSKIDIFVGLLRKELNIDTSSSIQLEDKAVFTAYLIEYFDLTNLDIADLTSSKFSEEIWMILESLYSERFLDNGDVKIPRRKELVTKLLEAKNVVYKELDKITTSVENNLYDLNKNHIFQDYSKSFSSKAFKFLILPLIGRELDFIKLVHSVINAYKSVINCQKIEEKVLRKIEAFKDLDDFKNNVLLKNDIKIHTYFRRFIIHLKNKCNEEVDYSDSGNPKLVIESENRTYDVNQDTLIIHAFIQNTGTGIAKNICIMDASLPRQKIIEFLPPTKKVKVKFNISTNKNADESDDVFNLGFTVNYENDFDEKKEFVIKDFLLKKQKADLPWDELKRTNPYSIHIVDDPNKLFGREKFIEDLKWNIEESRNILSYVIFGQKRVGKSSIVRTLDTIYSDNASVIYIYKTIGDVRSLDPVVTFQKLSRILFTRLTQEFRKRNSHIDLDSMQSINNFDSSLSGLIDIIDEIKFYSNVRIVFALDEFDELNKEFFENSELGKTFALNIGKGINERPNVGFILVGSETMEQKTKQGMRLNAFELKKVDTFDRQTEFEAYTKIITEPTKICLKFPDETIEYLFEYTSGNPYFTNLLLGKIFSEAYDKRISFMDAELVKNIVYRHVNLLLSQKDFQHFWDDGLSEEAVNYEKVLDRRRRVLTAFAETKNEKGDSCSWSDIKRKLKYPKKYSISENQMEDTLNEFKQRNIIKDVGNGVLKIIPNLFEDWLLGPGLYQVIAQLEDKDEILDLVHQENKLYLTDEELKEIYNYLHDGDKKNGVLILRNFLEQFENNKDRRLIAELLQKAFVISASEAIDFIKRTKKHIWTQPIELALDERNIRKDTEIFCSPDTLQQNKHYLDILKTEFRIAQNKLVKNVNDFSALDEGMKNIIFFEPVIDCPYYFRNEISKFLKKINPLLVRVIKIHLITFIISEDAKDEIEKLFEDYFAFDFSIHFLKNVQRSDISPYFNSSEAINDPTWKLICSVYKNSSNLSCLIKIGQLIPYQVFPMFWSAKNIKFTPLFSNDSTINYTVHDERFRLSEELKLLKFQSETKQLEFKASLNEPSINWKQIQKKAKIFKAMSVEKIEQIATLCKDLEDLWLLKFAEKGKIVKGIKHSIAKTIAAFGNTDGGELFVGIEDDFTIMGMVTDIKTLKDYEGILEALDKIIENYLGKEFSKLITPKFTSMENGIVILKIDIKKSEQDIWVYLDKEGNEPKNSPEFYIRAQQETVLLGAKDLLSFKKT